MKVKKEKEKAKIKIKVTKTRTVQTLCHTFVMEFEYVDYQINTFTNKYN